MNTYPTIEAAREAADDQIDCILEIEPTQGHQPYVLCKAPERIIRQLLARKPMPEIKRVVRCVADLAAERKAAHDQLMATNVLGLDELDRECSADEDAYYRQRDAIERGDGFIPAKRVSRAAEIAAKYPRAAAYRKARAYMLASHFEKSAAGMRACERIMHGEEIDRVLRDMDAEWSAAAVRCVENS